MEPGPQVTPKVAAADAIWNPALRDPSTVSLEHSLRRPLVERLLGLLTRLGETGAPQHQLILGAPGSGKTMLLRTLRAAIAADLELSRRWLPLTFPEAQWDILRPADLWTNALDYLVVALERLDESRGDGEAGAGARRLEALIGELPVDEDARARAALALLVSESGRIGRRFVLLVDTLDTVLDRLKRDQWHVREVLSAEPRLMLVGTSARAIEGTYRYDAAFYDFFQLHELRPLPRDRLGSLLEGLAPSPLRERLLGLVASHPAALGGCLDLVGTQPRCLALIANAVHNMPEPRAEALVASVLDALSPALLAKMDALAPQAQAIVHALATAWHPARPQEVAARARLSPNVASAQLHRLVQDGLAEKVPLPPGARHAFMLSDRLFQVWLLMRLGQPHRRRLVAACRALEAAHAGVDAEPADLAMLFDAGTPPARLAPELERLARSNDRTATAGPDPHPPR